MVSLEGELSRSIANGMSADNLRTLPEAQHLSLPAHHQRACAQEIKLYSQQAMNHNHGKNGEFKRKGGVMFWVIVLVVLSGFAVVIGHPYAMKWIESNEVSVVMPIVAPIAHADTMTKEVAAYMSIEQLKKEMVEKIWNAESRKDTAKSGDLFITYDPSAAMKASGVCSVIGGHRPVDCDSYGPMQIKLGTIQVYWTQMHDGEKITQLDALAITQDVEKAKAFFLECSIKVPGCVMNWTYANNHPDYFNIVLPIIRAAEVK